MPSVVVVHCWPRVVHHASDTVSRRQRCRPDRRMGRDGSPSEGLRLRTLRPVCQPWRTLWFRLVSGDCRLAVLGHGDRAHLAPGLSVGSAGTLHWVGSAPPRRSSQVYAKHSQKRTCHCWVRAAPLARSLTAFASSPALCGSQRNAERRCLPRGSSLPSMSPSGLRYGSDRTSTTGRK